MEREITFPTQAYRCFTSRGEIGRKLHKMRDYRQAAYDWAKAVRRIDNTLAQARNVNGKA